MPGVQNISFHVMMFFVSYQIILFVLLMPIQEPRTSSTTVCRRDDVLQSASYSQSGILQAGSSKSSKIVKQECPSCFL